MRISINSPIFPHSPTLNKEKMLVENKNIATVAINGLAAVAMFIRSMFGQPRFFYLITTGLPAAGYTTIRRR